MLIKRTVKPKQDKVRNGKLFLQTHKFNLNECYKLAGITDYENFTGLVNNQHKTKYRV